MWTRGWRERVWGDLDRPWDLIVMGGGITGAGILREASLAGIRTLLVEQGDFAAGTSSRSSKMVHGGLRYLANLQFKLTAESVRERERLLRAGRGLIAPLHSVIASYEGDRPPAWVVDTALTIYDILALKWSHKRHDAGDMRRLCPSLNTAGLKGGFSYYDAQTDDARLVLRVIREGVRAGGVALNYACVEDLLRDKSGRVHGVRLRDSVDGREREARAPVVISATGAWADVVRSFNSAPPRLRPLRGSHLFFPHERLPLTQSIGFMHPADRRPVFAYPWEGVTLVGTTDVDQRAEIPIDPRISEREVDYLMAAVQHAFKPASLGVDDVLSTMTGVRAVVDTGQEDPSKESRDFVLWDENGLLTVTGGKLTTFRVMAQRALRAMRHKLPSGLVAGGSVPILDGVDDVLDSGLDPQIRARLIGRYGADAPALIEAARNGELAPIGDSTSLWAELRWAARAEAVVHLDDLLLRRVRLGIVSPQGGLPLMERIRSIAQSELGWDDDRWNREVENYSRLWRESYSVTP